MNAIIASFRRGRRTQSANQMIVHVEKISDKEKATALVGKKVVWKSPAGKEISGEVSAAHGNKGAVRVIFEKGMPGQSVGNQVALQ